MRRELSTLIGRMPARDAAKDGQRALSPDIRGYRDARHISRMWATQHHLPRTPLAAACPLTHRHPQGLGAADPTVPSQPKAFSSASKALSPMFSLQRVGSKALHPTRNALPRAAAQRQRKVVTVVGGHYEPCRHDRSGSKFRWSRTPRWRHTRTPANVLGTSAPNLPDFAKTVGLRWVRTASVAIRNLTYLGCWQKTRLPRALLVINRTGARIQVHERRLQGRQLRACGLAARHHLTQFRLDFVDEIESIRVCRGRNSFSAEAGSCFLLTHT
jgi:hypothetical protein